MTQAVQAASGAGDGRLGIQPGPYRLLLLVSLGAVLAPLNSTMLAVALPAIRGDFGTSHAAVGWLVSSYLIAMAVIQPPAGRLGDELGRVRVFRGGLAAFLVFSIAAAVAPSFWLLVAFRTLQAVSGAILIPNGIAMLRAGVPDGQFGKFSGLNSAFIGASAAAGPMIGGALLLLGPWRVLFLVNIPIIALAMVLTRRVPIARGQANGSARPDWTGIALFTALLALVTWLLNSIRDGGSAVVAGVMSALLVTATLFLRRQMRTRTPVAAWALFRQRSFAGAASHILLMNLAMYTTLLAIPFLLIEVQGRGSTASGILLAAMAAMQAVTAPFAGWVADAMGRRKPTIASSLIALVAALMLAFGVSHGTSFVYLAAALAMLGLGVGIGFVSATVAAVEAAPRNLSGSAAGTQSMMRYGGSIVGVGLLTGLLSTTGTADVATFRALFAVVAAIVSLSLVAAWFVRPFSEP